MTHHRRWSDAITYRRHHYRPVCTSIASFFLWKTKKKITFGETMAIDLIFNAANAKAHILPSFRHDERRNKNLKWAWPRRQRWRRRLRRSRWRRSIQWNKHKFLMEHQCHRVVLHGFFYLFRVLSISLSLPLACVETVIHIHFAMCINVVDRRQRKLTFDCKLNSFAENRKFKQVHLRIARIRLSVCARKSILAAKMQNQFTTAS